MARSRQKRKLGRGVALVGAGMSHFGSFPEKLGRDLFVEAFQAMRATVDVGLDPREIEALYVGNFSGELFENQGHSAPILAEWTGLLPRPATRIEDACASGGAALRQGILAVASGLYDVVLVGGVEKMSGLPIGRVTEILATAGDEAYEIPAGFTFPGFYGAMASAYFAHYGATSEMLMEIARKNHANGALNDHAQFRFTLAQAAEKTRAAWVKKGLSDPAWNSLSDFLHDPRANPFIASPLRLYDCSPVSDGAAALLLVAEDRASGFSRNPLYITGTGQASGGALYSRGSLSSIPSAQAAALEAYALAGIRPKDIQLAEVHDCFTIAEAIGLEDIGLFEPGQAASAAQEGITTLEGRLPVNTSGGLKAKGHPVGASGAAQVVEIWQQMRCEAGARQVKRDLTTALTHNVGGTGQTSVVHIFERR